MTVVVARSLVFTFWPQSFLDANQAVIGLMAKHIAEGRASRYRARTRTRR